MANSKTTETTACVTGIGLLSDFHLMHYVGVSGCEVGVGWAIDGKVQEFSDFSKGFRLTPNLTLRFSNQADSKALSFYPTTPKSCMQYCLNKYVLECSFDVENNSKTFAETSTIIHKIINNTITALRLLKSGYIESNTILNITAIESNRHPSLMVQKTIPAGSFRPPYDLRTDELSNFKKLINKISSANLDNRKSFKIALSRFENSYYNLEDQDKLIDYMISFEALFTEGKKKQSQRDVISVACSMLLGKTQKERTKIQKTLNQAYSIRNNIVHGLDFEEKLSKDLFFNDFVEEVEDLLRRSLRKLI